MERTADVVIIGGGIVGVSAAYYLARLGVKRVLLLEQGGLGEGSTIRSAGIVRGPFSTEINCRFGLESLRIFEGFRDEMGVEIGYHQVGYLILSANAEETGLLAEAVALQRKVGLETRLVDPGEIKGLAPYLQTADLAGGIYTPHGGYASQHETVMGFAQRARELGAGLRTYTACTAIRVENGKVVGVESPDGFVATETVLLAAGVWSRELAASVGVDLPVFSSRSQVVMMHPPGGPPKGMPVIADYAGAFYTRPELEQLLVGLSNSEEPVSHRTDVDWNFIYEVLPRVVHRMPFAEQAGVGTAWAGSIEYTPDKHPVIGRAPEVEGLLLAAGFSGHGFMHGPVAGKLTAELIALGSAQTVEISALDLRRFDINPPPGLGPIKELFSYSRKAIADYRRGAGPKR